MDSKSLERKLSSVKESSEDIQALSRWCIQHRSHQHSIVQAWSRAIRKAKVGHRLTLFYVCNDIVQNARRKKCPELVQFFGTAVKEAAPLVREDKIRKKILRIFNIWEERGIYDSKLVTEFVNIVEKVGTVNSTENDIVLSTFQLEQLVDSVKNLTALERTSQNLLADLKTQEHMLTEEEIKRLRLTVKERGASRERLEEFEESVSSLEFYISSLQNEIDERTKAVTLLEQAEIFYETQRGEAKLVVMAYKNFNSRVKFLKKKLNDKLPSLPEPPSPVPTPPLDAPSPQSDIDDISIEENHQNSEELTSFLNSNTVPSFMEKAKESMKSDIISVSPYDSESRMAERIEVAKSPTVARPTSKERTLEEEQKDFEIQIAGFAKHRKTFMEAKPMNAKELLDTFGKSISSPSSTAPASFHIPAPVPPIPLPPDPPMVMSSVPSTIHMAPISTFPGLHSALPIPLPPSAPPPVPPNIPLPQAFPPPPLPPPPIRMEFPPPLPTVRPYQPYATATAPPGIKGPWSDGWMPLPPPPPPPPPMNVKEPKIPIETPWNRGPPQFPEDGWNSYEANADEEPPEDDNDCDDRNWGEPPGSEELHTFDQLQAAAEEEKSAFLIPPPPPPPQFSSLTCNDDDNSNSKRRSNLVNIEPNSKEELDVSSYCFDYRSLTSESSFINDGLFNSGDTDMRILPSDKKRNGDGSGSDMDISEGESSDYDRPRRHRRENSRSELKEVDDSPHKPVSFSLAKGSKPLIPLTGKTSGFNQEDDDNFRKRSLPMPPSYVKRQKKLERQAEMENVPVTASSIPVLSNPILTNVIESALNSVRANEAMVEKEPSVGPSISEALGMYYDSDNESDIVQTEEEPVADEHFVDDGSKHSFEGEINENQPILQATVEKSSVLETENHFNMETENQYNSKPDNLSNAEEEEDQSSIPDDSLPNVPADNQSDNQSGVNIPTDKEAEKPSNVEEFSQVIESFISETRADESDKQAFTESLYVDEPFHEVEQTFPDSGSSHNHPPPNVPDQPYQSFEHAQPITAMYSTPPPFSRPYPRAGGWQQYGGQGFQGNRPPPPRPRGMPPRGYPPRQPFNRGRGGFRGRSFDAPMGPRWHARGNRQPWW